MIFRIRVPRLGFLNLRRRGLGVAKLRVGIVLTALPVPAVDGTRGGPVDVLRRDADTGFHAIVDAATALVDEGQGLCLGV